MSKTMIKRLLIQSLFMVCFWACSSGQKTEPNGPIAGFGSTPTIDGVFEDGEWDDAEVVHTGKNQQFRLKHDHVNLYLALDAGGGNLWFDKEDGLHVLHWSSQLGSATYKKTDSLMHVLDKPFNHRLWKLQDEPPDVIRKTLIAYLEEEGWTANIAPLGPKMQSEFAISFEWLGIKPGSEQYIQIPGIHICGGLMLTRSDPEFEKIMDMTLDERKKQYPSLFWPESPENHPLNGGPCPDTIQLDPVDFGIIWIDLGDDKEK